VPPSNADVLVGIITNPNVDNEFRSTDDDFGVHFPPGFFTQPVVVLGTRQPDNTQVNNQAFDEFPLKVDISIGPPGVENTTGIKALVKVCTYVPGEVNGEVNGDGNLEHADGLTDNLVLFQAGVGVLTKPEGDPPPSLPCNNTDELTDGLELAGSSGFVERTFAAAIRALRGAGAFAAHVLSPRELFAAKMFVDGGVGGEVLGFESLFAAVDPSDGDCESECLTRLAGRAPLSGVKAAPPAKEGAAGTSKAKRSATKK